MKSPNKKKEKHFPSNELTSIDCITISDDKRKVYFTTKDFIQIYKALEKGLITKEVIDDTLNDFINDSEFANSFKYNFEEALNHFSLMFKRLSADIEYKCANMINERSEHIDLFRDNFIESIPKDKTFKQVDILKYKVISKGTLITHESKFQTEGSSSYNISKFAEWMKGWNYDKYLIFKEKYKEDLKKKAN